MKHAALLGLAVVTFGVQAVMAPAYADIVCNDRLIEGSYSAGATGFLYINGAANPVASERTSNFDGVGGFTGAGYQAIGGTAPVKFKTTGTYKVHADCTVTITAPITGGTAGVSNQFGLVTDNGNRIHAIRIDGGYVLTFDYDRIAQ